MRLLALDLAGSVGFAFWHEGLAAPLYGALKLPKRAPGQTFAEFRDFLIAKIAGERVEHIAVESPYIGKDSFNAVERLYGLRAHVDEIAYRRGVSVHPVVSSEWRKHFIGQTRAPQTLSKAHRRAWLKKQVRAECERRGWPVKNDDESDAIGILIYERARLMPAYGCDGDLLGFQAMQPLGMERAIA